MTLSQYAQNPPVFPKIARNSQMRRHCTECGSCLRAGNSDTTCAPCRRTKPLVPAGFYDTPELQNALRNYDFRQVFPAVRKAAGLSQQRFAELTGITQQMISLVERGKRNLRDVLHIAQLANALRIPPHLLGFGTESGSLDPNREVSQVQRRDFLSIVLGITMSSTLHPDIARLSEMLPAHTDSIRRRRIGVADAEAIENMTDWFRQTVYAQGGGLIHSAALAQLQAVRSFDDALCTEEIRERVDLAIADLAWIVGWASRGIGAHEQAEQLLLFALNRAKRAEQHPRSTDLTIGVLLDAAAQVMRPRQDHSRQARSALRLVELGFNVANTSIHNASASTHADLYANRAFYHATLGNSDQCHDALNREVETFATIRPDTVPPWDRHVTEAEIASHRAYAMGLLARTQPEFVPTAIEQLDAVVNDPNLTYASTRAFQLTNLSELYIRGGDLDTGIRIGHEAITAVNGLSSRHMRDRLQAIADAAEPFAAKSSDMAQLRKDVHAAVHDTQS
ncbi:helix-turn-helix domain-containing protein [Saccharopolyspora phatthalungensis]|uniref:Transcriptional regulator with XRE-family HTH domain n=1 Tax=Saccharopolyspora phatthalungensis TaxID=664693 RepID=A0A840QHQ2_9PSEU|nr:helix-turn-helix transcriptional regulator [Saccharopolyspora phatthalungensis]MBB5160066.1 transcriptional regulator with XRE-family HTH domain [Saccharopolyspora phatthalungensis]